jgi:hypothetical protein
VLYWVLLYAGVPLILPAVFFGVTFLFYVQAVLMTGKWGFGAFHVSRTAVRGRFFKTLFRLAVLLAVHGVFAFAVMLLTSFMPYSDGLLGTSVYSAFRQTAGLFFVYFTAIWFYNWHFVPANHKRDGKENDEQNVNGN